MLYAGRLDILLGGYPEDVPNMYRLACPTIHVHPDSPPTPSLRGDRDCLNPKEGNQELYAKLVESGVPAIDVVFPWTEHGFDLAFPQINPAAQSALYDVDRFLAVLLNRDRKRGLFSACGVQELVENQAIFKKNKAAKKAYFAAYNHSLDTWPVACGSKFVSTTFGATHFLVAEPINGKPIVLMHGKGGSAIMWRDNIAALSCEQGVFALDILGDLSKSTILKNIQIEVSLSIG